MEVHKLAENWNEVTCFVSEYSRILWRRDNVFNTQIRLFIVRMEKRDTFIFLPLAMNA